MNLITKGVMQGLVEASSHIKHSDSAMRVFNQAENDQDTEKMKRAMGYASKEMDKAAASADQAGEAVANAQEAERAEEKARQRSEALQANTPEQTQAPANVSAEAVLQAPGEAANPQSAPQETAGPAVLVQKFYTPNHGLITVPPEPKISVQV